MPHRTTDIFPKVFASLQVLKKSVARLLRYARDFFHRAEGPGAGYGQPGERENVQKLRTSQTPYAKSFRFVRNEFFRLDSVTFRRVSDFYASKYGDGPAQYMRLTYPKWKSKTTKMAGQTEQRIIECVPPFLPKDKQFELLSFQIPAVVDQQKSELKLFRIKTSELETIYRQLADNVSKHERKLDWFVKEIFPPKELNEFLNVLKFTMLDCLRLSYEQVRQDLLLMYDLTPNIDGCADLLYKISLLGCYVEADAYPPPGAIRLKISMPEPSLVTQFRDKYRTILLDHAITQRKAELVGKENQQLAVADIDAITAQLQKISDDQEYNTTLNIQGHGGTFSINIQKKNLSRLNDEIYKQFVKIVFTLVISVAVAVLLCVNGGWGILFFLAAIPIGIVSSICGKLQKLKSEVTDYERKRTKKFTAP